MNLPTQARRLLPAAAWPGGNKKRPCESRYHYKLSSLWVKITGQDLSGALGSSENQATPLGALASGTPAAKCW